jgi:hypothetical protein
MAWYSLLSSNKPKGFRYLPSYSPG